MDLLFWVISPFLIWFCGGCLLAFFVAAMIARQFVRSTMLGILCVIYAFVFCQSWIQVANERLLMLILVPVSLCFGAVLMCYKQFPKREILRKVIIIFVVVEGLIAGGITALGTLPPFGMYNTIEQTANSPDGRYQVILFYRDGLTFGYYFVAIKPTSFSLLNILDYPNTEIAEVASEGLSNVSWANQRTLVIGYYSDDPFVQQDKSWHDVKIVYKNNGKSPKKLKKSISLKSTFIQYHS
jgi:hypothetical protein